MSAAADPRCPQCGAPLPPAGAGLELLCPWCRALVRSGAGAGPPRELLLVDRSDRAEAQALLAQHLAVRFGPDAVVRGGGEPRPAPFWSVLTRDGELLAGPAARAEHDLLRRASLPSLPARPPDPARDEAVPRLAADLPLAEFLAARGDPPPAVERAWLVWAPVRLWQVRVAGRPGRALTVADAALPVVAATPPGRARAPWAALAPLLAWTLCLGVAGRLLPVALHVPFATALFVAGLWAWRRVPAREAGA